MKVLMISGGRGGVYKFTYEIIRRVSKRKFRFFIVFLTGNRKWVTSSPPNVPFVFINDLKQWKDFIKASKVKFDIIHSNFAAPIPSLTVTRKPIVFTCHGLPQPWLEVEFKEKFRFSFEKLMFPLGVKNATAVVSVSKFVKNQLELLYNVHSKVIYHGVDPASYNINDDKSNCKKRLQINPREKVILYVGKLHPYKDPLTLVKAFGIIARKQNKTRLVLVGKGKLHSKILELSRKLGIFDRLSIYNHLTFDELVLLYHAADVFVLPSINEAFGIVILEAMASRLPCIVANSGACSEIIQNSGLVFETGNYKDLAEKIIQILDDTKLARMLASKAYERVKKVFAWEKSVAQYEKLYSNLIS